MRFLSRVPVLVWFLIPTILIMAVGIWFVTKSSLFKPPDETKAEAVSKEVQGTVVYPIVGRTHIQEGTNGSGYNSNPPSSGPHWPSPGAKGIYEDTLRDEKALHNLEHGYIWIAFKKEIGDEQINKLQDIVKKDEYKMIMFPREANDAKIALVAWGRVLKMDSVDEQKVGDFIKTYRNRGPEKTTEQ